MTAEIFTAIGLMSGTSMDGIDTAMVVTDGHVLYQIENGTTTPYTIEFREKLKGLIKGYGDRNAITREMTCLHADAVEKLLATSGIKRGSVNLIGFHGHTIEHRPDNGVTVQIGDGALLSRLTGIDVINDFRSNDIKNGGQGAPLVPVYHQALFAGDTKPLAVVNIGGVSNITWIGDKEGDLIAFDTGPGNALLDDWVSGVTGRNFDAGGAIAKSGKVNKHLLDCLMNDGFLAKKPPKSLDRNHFTGIPENYNITFEDAAATLAAFTAASVSVAAMHFPAPAAKWLITGGGRHNAAIMGYLQEFIHGTVVNIDEVGMDGDFIEAQAFAFLAVRSYLGLPISFPGTTGVKKPVSGGSLIKTGGFVMPQSFPNGREG